MGAFEFVVSEGPNKGQTLAFPAAKFVIGSGPECQLRLDAALVQPRHAEISVTGDTVSVRDLTQSALVWLNGENLAEGTLGPGGFVRLGRIELAVRQAGQQRSPSGTIATLTPVRPSNAPRPASKISGATPIRLQATAKQALQAPVSDARPQTPHGRDLQAPSGSLNELAPGSVIDGRYVIIGKLAAGGMGEVYKAEHAELGKLFAIKVMLPELSRDAEFVARFKREAISASRIGQQNIVDISDFGQTSNGRFYFVMEFLDGLTLASVTHREGAVRVERVLNVALQVTRALAAAHAQGIVHRDLKPENIMLLQRPGQPDFVKVLDFGVAKVAAGHGQGGHTAVGMVVGTPQYMSPEQAKAIPVDARSDIYSLGLIFYELITGRPTFTAETPSMLMVKHVTEAPPPFEPGPLGEVPVELETLIFRMLEKEPSARPQTMEEVVTALDQLWTRFKTNDPTLRRISGEFPIAKPARRGPLATDAGRPSKTPARPSSKTPARVSGKRQMVLAEDSQDTQKPPERADEASDELNVRRSPMPFVVIGLLVVLAIGGGMLAMRGGGGEPGRTDELPVVEPATAPEKVELKAPPVEPPPTVTADPAKPPAPQRVSLTFKSTPSEAQIFEGEALLGATPLVLSRETDSKVTLRFELPGHEPKTQTFGFVATQTMIIELKKEPAKPTTLKSKKQPGLKDPYEDPADQLKDFQ